VKRRLVAVCQEVGLVIDNANMHLMKDQGVRLIHVGASLPHWTGETPMLSLMADVGINGQWPKTVDIRCTASTKPGDELRGPWMKGRGAVPFQDLIEPLRETLKEREQVIALVAAGEAGPYVFQQSVWDSVDPLKDLDLF
jgi:hypothetical protein